MNEHFIKWMARPAGMWVAVATYAYSGIGVSLLNGLMKATSSDVIFQPVDALTQDNLLIILLGIGAMRSFDKRNK
jgi:hypothetical protein